MKTKRLKTKTAKKVHKYPQPSGDPKLIQPELILQEGYMIKIRREHPKAKKKGWEKDSLHVIQKPPKNYRNTMMGVFILNKKGKVDFLYFPYMTSTGITKSEFKKSKHS